MRFIMQTGPAVVSGAKRFLQVEGGYYEVGRQHGSACRDEIVSFIEDQHAQVNLLRATPLDERELRQRLDGYLERIVRERSDLAAEIYGLADGAGIDVRQACLLQVRRDLIGYRKIPALGDCSTIGSAGAAPFLAQTVDLSGHMAPLSMVMRIDGRGRGAPDILMFTFKGLLGYLGMNSAGLCVGINMVLAGEWSFGIPPYLAVRLMLECRSVEQCIALLSGLPLASSRSFTLLDANRLVMLELVPGRGVVLSPERPVAAHTNHFLDPQLAREDEINILGRNSSLRRLAVLEAYLAARREAVTAQGLMALLSSHDLYPDGLCVHNKGDLKRERSVAAVVMLPGQRRMWVKFGQPCESAAVEWCL